MASGHAAKLTPGDLTGGGALSVGERRGNAEMRELPDADDGAQNEEAVDESFKKTALFFLRADEHGVGRSANWIGVWFHKDSLVAFPYAMPVPRLRRKSQGPVFQ